VTACSKSPESGGAAPTPKADLATQAGLTNTLTSKLGISEAQATAAVGSVLSLAKGKLSPADYDKLSGAIPGADKYLAAAPDIGAAAAPNAVTPPSADSTAAVPLPSADSAAAGAAAPGADVAAAGADAAAAAGKSVGMSTLNSAFSKIGLPPETASQFVPVLTDYVGKVGGPEAANILKGLF
jgi:hypothetical protein